MPDQPGEEELYDLADESSRPAAKPPQPSAPVAKPAALNYRTAKADVSARADTETVKNLYMPLWLLGGGVVIEVIAGFLRTNDSTHAVIYVGIELILGTLIMLIGIFLAAKIRGIQLGNFWTAVLKLAAISIAPSALIDLAGSILRFIPFGFLLGWAAEFIFYFALLGALFDLEESDTWYCVIVIFAVRMAVYLLILRTLAG